VVVGGKVATQAKQGQDFQRQFGNLRKRATQYIADLQRGYEVLLLAGALGGLVLSLVRPLASLDSSCLRLPCIPPSHPSAPSVQPGVPRACERQHACYCGT
jgi:hypothetical protein